MQQTVDSPDQVLENKFYDMNKKLGDMLDKETDAFYIRKKWGSSVSALHLCMAPGGYTWHFLQRNPNAEVCGITLSPDDGGHPMYLPYGEQDQRVEVRFLDITMLASEFGTPISQVPVQHPEAAKFSADRPFLGKEFDNLICDGQVLRVHQHLRSRSREATRLLVAQLILGLQRIKPGGTFIILLHKVDAWDTLSLLQTFETFSTVVLFKPEKIHAARSSFYLVAKKVRPNSDEAKEALDNWKAQWLRTTFAGDDCTGLDPEEPTEEEVRSVLDAYGKRLRDFGKPLWSIQLAAMKKTPFVLEKIKHLA